MTTTITLILACPNDAVDDIRAQLQRVVDANRTRLTRADVEVTWPWRMS